jgi:hypothetical protein
VGLGQKTEVRGQGSKVRGRFAGQVLRLAFEFSQAVRLPYTRDLEGIRRSGPDLDYARDDDECV